MTATPLVVDASAVAPRALEADLFTERAVLGSHTGFHLLEQSVLECPAGGSAQRATGSAEELLFVLAGDGLLRIGETVRPLERESGAYLPPGIEYQLEAGEKKELRIVSVRVPDPVDATPGAEGAAVVRRLADQEAEQATADREFRIVNGPSTGLRSATHFVGYIPVGRAPEHFHTYDEVIYVLDGEGAFHGQGRSEPLAPGSCIALPARTVHSLENEGPGVMRVVAVFRPAGSPAAAYYPDGTPAYEGMYPPSVAPPPTPTSSQ